MTPLAGVVLITLASRARPAAAGLIALLTCLLGLGLSVPVWLRYDPAGSPYQLLEQGQVLTKSGAAYVVGADGLTVLAVLGIEVVGLLAILASWPRRAERNPLRHAGLLIFQAAMLGVVMSLDALLFAFWWAVLLTTVAITTKTGRPARWRTITLVTASVVALLAGILMIHAAVGEATGVLSFDLAKLQQVSLPPDRQVRPLLALCAAFATAAVLLTLGARSARTPAHAAFVLTALVLLPAYGVVRFNLAILPQAARAFVPGIAALAMAALLVAVAGAWRTRQASRILTWAAVGQVAVILLGLTVIDPQALAGSLIQPVAVALALAPLAAVLARSSPRSRVVAAGAWILTLAAAGLPGLIAFTGGAAIVRGTAHAHPMWALGASAGLVVIAAAMVRATRLTLSDATAQGTREPGARAAIALGFAGVAVLMGIAPEPVRARLQPTMARVITRLDAGYTPAFASVPGCGGSLPAPSAPAGFTALAPCDSAAPPAK